MLHCRIYRVHLQRTNASGKGSFVYSSQIIRHNNGIGQEPRSFALGRITRHGNSTRMIRSKHVTGDHGYYKLCKTSFKFIALYYDYRPPLGSA